MLPVLNWFWKRLTIFFNLPAVTDWHTAAHQHAASLKLDARHQAVDWGQTSWALWMWPCCTHGLTPHNLALHFGHPGSQKIYFLHSDPSVTDTREPATETKFLIVSFYSDLIMKLGFGGRKYYLDSRLLLWSHYKTGFWGQKVLSW